MQDTNKPFSFSELTEGLNLPQLKHMSEKPFSYYSGHVKIINKKIKKKNVGWYVAYEHRHSEKCKNDFMCDKYNRYKAGDVITIRPRIILQEDISFYKRLGRYTEFCNMHEKNETY